MTDRVVVEARERRADVVVIGAGPAGIAAAACAAEAGARVVVLDEGVAPGGQIWRSGRGVRLSQIAQRWTDRLARSGATFLSGTSCVNVQRSSANELLVVAEEREGPLCVRATRVVIATGARERFLPFPGWTLPGVVGIGAAQALLKSGVSFTNKRIVIAGSGPLLLPVAASLARHGAHVLLVAEQAAFASVGRFAAGLWRTPRLLFDAATLRTRFIGTSYVTSAWATRVEGDDRVQTVKLMTTNGERALECDVLCTGFGLVPNVELARLAGCAVGAMGVSVDERQHTSVPDIYCAGEPTGIGGVDRALVEGEIAGRCAAGEASVPRALATRRARLHAYSARLERAFALRPELRTIAPAETMVCRCEDVRLRAIDPRWSARQAKLYTRAGMGACQGRVCGAALDFLCGSRDDTVRPPILPVRVDTMIAQAHVQAPEHDPVAPSLSQR